MSDTTQQAGLNVKLMTPIAAIIDKQRATLTPMLQGGTGQAAQAALRDDECVRKVATFCYPLLPGLLRLAVKEPAFVSFVLNNREKVLGPLTRPA
jgi:hypothetical protein